jgi:hypothetical protein
LAQILSHCQLRQWRYDQLKASAWMLLRVASFSAKLPKTNTRAKSRRELLPGHIGSLPPIMCAILTIQGILTHLLWRQTVVLCTAKGGPRREQSRYVRRMYSGYPFMGWLIIEAIK